MNRLNHIHYRARLIHLQMESAHKLLLETNPDIADSVYADTSPYVMLLNSLYENDYAIAELYQDADIVLHLDGPAAHSKSPSVNILQWMLNSINKPLSNMMSSKMMIATDVFKRSLDIQLTGIAHGSIYAGFKVAERESKNQGLLERDENTLKIAQDSIASIASVPQVITNSEISDEVFSLFPDPIDRDIALMTAYKIAPTGRNDINILEIEAPKKLNSKFARLDTNDRVVLHATVAKSPILRKEAKTGSFIGEIRGLDIDKTRLVLRKVESDEFSSLVCSYYNLQTNEAKNLIGKRVKVTGEYEVSADGVPKLMRVNEITALQDLIE